MKRTLALIPLIAIALTACSADSDNTTTTITPQPVTETAETTTEQPAVGAIGTPVNIATLPDNEVNMTITDIQLGGECKYGKLDVSWLEDAGVTGPDMQLLQISADVENVKLDNPQTQNSFIWLEDPKIVDSDGYTSEPGLETTCDSPTDNHQDWTSYVNVGEKKRLYRAWAVPMNVEMVTLHDMTFEVGQ